MKKIGFFLGCNTAFNRPDNEQAVRYALPALGIEIDDLEGQTCCPAFGSMPSVDETAWAASSAWNLVVAEERGVDLVTTCGSCYGSISEAAYNMQKHPDVKVKVNEIFRKVGKEYKGTSRMRSLMNYCYNEIGVDKIKEAIKYRLDGMTVAVHPGCHNLWPSKAYPESEEDTFHPKWLRELCEALGGSAPAYSRLTDCCGMGALRSTSPERALTFFKKKIDTVKEELNPDLVVVGCNSCLMQFDGSQATLHEKKEIDYTIPSLHYMQILAICLGADPKRVAGLSELSIDNVINRLVKVEGQHE